MLVSPMVQYKLTLQQFPIRKSVTWYNRNKHIDGIIPIISLIEQLIVPLSIIGVKEASMWLDNLNLYV